MAKRIDRKAWLERLDRIEHDPSEKSERSEFERMGLAGSLLQLANITLETEYALCRQLAEHLLGTVPDPGEEDIDQA